MSRRAWIFLSITYAAAIIFCITAFLDAPQSAVPWLSFAALGVLGAFAASYRVVTPQHTTLNMETLVLFAGLYLLPFWMFCALVILVLSAAWLRELLTHSGLLRDWYVQPFHMARHILAGATARLLVTGFNGNWQLMLSTVGLARVAASAFVYSAVSEVWLALAHKLVRQVPLRNSSMLQDIFAIEFPQACLGFGVVLAWNWNPWLILLFLSPMVLVHQAFQLPKVHMEEVRQLESTNRQLSQSQEQVQQQNGDLYKVIARVFDARDPYAGEHAARVAAFAVRIAQELGLPPERVDRLRQAGYLHDIGKIDIPEYILRKRGHLTKEEFQTVQQHPERGAALIEETEGLRPLAEFVRHHHERWDGLGYPDGLRGVEIPLEARILNVCDSVESMSAERPYRKAMTAEQIVDELDRCKGSQFDPIIANLFIELLQRDGLKLDVTAELAQLKTSQPPLADRAQKPVFDGF